MKLGDKVTVTESIHHVNCILRDAARHWMNGERVVVLKPEEHEAIQQALFCIEGIARTS